MIYIYLTYLSLNRSRAGYLIKIIVVYYIKLRLKVPQYKTILFILIISLLNPYQEKVIARFYIFIVQSLPFSMLPFSSICASW